MTRTTDLHARDAAAAIAALDSDGESGLSADEAARRLEQSGPNELAPEARRPAIVLLLAQFRNTLLMMLFVAVVLSAVIGDVVDALIILVIVVFCAVLGFVQEYRAERALGALKQMLAPTVRVVRDATVVEVASRNLVPGDVLLLEAGDRLAADARLLESHSLRCDESSLTGESEPVDKDLRPLAPATPVPERSNCVYAGTIVTYGRGRALVVGTGMQSEIGRIAREVSDVDTGPTPLEVRTREIGRLLATVCVLICLAVAAVSVARGVLQGEADLPFLITMVMFAVALAVAAVPEALPAIVTGALALGMHSMAKRNAIVKTMPAVETLGCTTVICSDKTGTLTTGEMTIRRIVTADGEVGVSGAGYAPHGELVPMSGDPEAGGTLRALLEGGVLCNDAELVREGTGWTIKGDPTEAALLVAAEKSGVSVSALRDGRPRLRELPFSSERMRMTTVHPGAGPGTDCFMKGAAEVVLRRCDRFATADAVLPLDDGRRAEILAASESMAGDALRVLAVASRTLEGGEVERTEDLESGMTFLGLVGMIDPPREEAAEAVRTCRSIGIKPVMITGDHELTAVAIARELDIYREGDRIATGADLDAMTDDDLARAVDGISVYARVSPLHKLKIVRAFKSRGEVVAMTGDGVNDAPALRHADIGVAMGITGTDVAKEAADMVLADDNFATIVVAIERGRWIYDNIKKYLAYLLRCNLTEVCVIGGIVLMMGPEFLPLLPTAILFLNLATDGLPALALGVAPPEHDIMRRPPRDPTESVLSFEVKAFMVAAMIVEIPFFYYLFLRDAGDLEQARTAMFFAFVAVEFVIALNCRSLVFGVFQAPPHRWLVLSVVFEIVLVTVLIQLPAVRSAFGIGLPGWDLLGLVLLFSGVAMLAIEAVKYLVRRRRGEALESQAATATDDPDVT